MNTNEAFVLVAFMAEFQAWTARAHRDDVDRETAFVAWRPDLSGWIGDGNGIILEFDSPQKALAWLLDVRYG